jgi:tetratricopeptide (TPR) repeat protein
MEDLVSEADLSGEIGSDGGFIRLLDHYAAADAVTASFESVESDAFRVRYAPGADMILGEEGLEVLSACHRELAPLLGGPPDHRVVVELFPTADAFIEASDSGGVLRDEAGQPVEGSSRWRTAVNTTGVIGLSKWTRLLVTSPRAKARGYNWKDTVAHEYVHLVVASNSGDRVPVWLQEGLAKALEGRWRGEKRVQLTPYQESLLSQALASDSMVTLEQMHPSIALLPSAEHASLAFAEVALMVDFAISEGGEKAVSETIAAVRRGVDAKEALAQASGFERFEPFYLRWLEHLRSLDLEEAKLGALPTVLDAAGGDFAEDPVLAKRKDLADFARLGDLLMDADRPLAALVEYTKAIPEDEPVSPMLANRLAACHVQLDAPAQALQLLQQSAAHYPEFALTHKALGSLYVRDGATRRAIEAYRVAHDLNPYDSEVELALVALYETADESENEQRHARFARILRSAGRPLD